MIQPLDFAKAVLLTLGAPVSENNVRSLVGWIAQEGGHYANGAKYNPLNTTMSAPGAESFGAPHIKIYVSWEQGLDATVRTLKNGLYNSILAAFGRSADPEETLAIIDQTPWGTHNYKPGSANAWIASGMRLNDPRPNEGGGLAVLSTGGTFMARLRQRLPFLAGLGLLGGAAYYVASKR